MSSLFHVTHTHTYTHTQSHPWAHTHTYMVHIPNEISVVILFSGAIAKPMLWKQLRGIGLFNWLVCEKLKGLMLIREKEKILYRACVLIWSSKHTWRWKCQPHHNTQSLSLPPGPSPSLSTILQIWVRWELPISEWPAVFYGFNVVWRLNPYENNISLLLSPTPGPLEAAAFHI